MPSSPPLPQVPGDRAATTPSHSSRSRPRSRLDARGIHLAPSRPSCGPSTSTAGKRWRRSLASSPAGDGLVRVELAPTRSVETALSPPRSASPLESDPPAAGSREQPVAASLAGSAGRSARRPGRRAKQRTIAAVLEASWLSVGERDDGVAEGRTERRSERGHFQVLAVGVAEVFLRDRQFEHDWVFPGNSEGRIGDE